MPKPDRPPLTRGVVLRGIGFAVAIALGAIAVWLIVTSDTQKSLRIGILVGLWGLLLGAYALFGARRSLLEEARAHSEQPAPAAPPESSRRELAVHEARLAVERAEDASSRREFEARLERLIQREITNGVARETAALRTEIAHLRQELLEKMGGQLRLERIETTRVIGSDLEALQHEVRQLKSGREELRVAELLAGVEQRVALRPVVEPARVRPVTRPAAEAEADVRPAQRDEPAAPVAPPPAAPPVAPAAARPPVPQPPPKRPDWRPPPKAEQAPSQPAQAVSPTQRPSEAVAQPGAARRDAASRVHQPPAGHTPPPNGTPAAPATPPAREVPTASPRDDADPFAALPRLSPFTDVGPDAPTNGAAAPNGREPLGYTGRRRRGGEAEGADDEPEGADAPDAPESADAAGGRRRRAEGAADGSDLLARLLARETGARGR